MRTTPTYPILVIEDDDYITDVMRRTAEGSFPEAVLHFAIDDQAAQRSLTAGNPSTPELIMHGTKYRQLLTQGDPSGWLSEHPVASRTAQLLLGYSDLPVSGTTPPPTGAPTYHPKPEMIIEWACFWAQLRRQQWQQGACLATSPQTTSIRPTTFCVAE